MTPGIWTSFFIDLSPEDAVITFASRGWLNLELSSEHGGVLLQRGDPIHAGKELRQFAADRGVKFPQGHLWLAADIAAPDQQAVIDRLRQWLDLFVSLGIEAAVLHPGGHTLQEQGAGPDEISESRFRALSALSKHVEGTDLFLCLENSGSGYDPMETVEAFGSLRLAVCLDTGHLHRAGGGQAEFIRRAGSHLKALHVDDNEGTADQHLMPYGPGTVPWEEVTAALRALPYTGLFNFEIGGERKCPMAVRLRKLDYLKDIAAYMIGGNEAEG